MPARLHASSVIAALQKLGLHFRLNECSHQIEVNCEAMNDGHQADINMQLRGMKVYNKELVSDIITAQAHANSYHPVREYLLRGLKHYDGGAHIVALAAHVKDTDSVFGTWLRRWLIGACAKVFEAE